MDKLTQDKWNLLIIGLFSFSILAGCNDAPSAGNPKESSPVEAREPSGESPEKVDSEIKSVSIKIVTPEQYQEELEKHQGKVIFVDFWATWCINCIKGMKETAELSKEYKKDGLVVLMMCLDENSEEVRKRTQKILLKRKCFFPSLMAKDGSSDKTFQEYKIEGEALPHYKLYGRDGKLIQAFISSEESSISHEEVKKKIAEALKK